MAQLTVCAEFWDLVWDEEARRLWTSAPLGVVIPLSGRQASLCPVTSPLRLEAQTT